MDHSRAENKVTETPPPKCFELTKLPRELRDMIWEYAIDDLNPQSDDPCWGVRQEGCDKVRYGCLGEGNDGLPAQENDGWLAEGPDTEAIFCNRQPHPIAIVCKEAYAAALRYNGKLGRRDLGYRRRVPIVTTIYQERTDSLLPILPPNNSPLVLNLAYRPDNPHDLSSARLLELVLAAKDDQIKLMLPEIEHFSLPFEYKEGGLPDVAQAWLDKHGDRSPLISFNNAAMWQELSTVYKSYKPTIWRATHEYLTKKGRKSIVRRAIGPLEKMWKYENRIRLRENKEALKPLPRIDVVVYVTPSQLSRSEFRIWALRGAHG